MTKTTTTTMRLEARSPAWLEAKADLAAAERIAKAARTRPGQMEGRNHEHAREVAAKTRTGSGPLVTNGWVHERGSGSGHEVIYNARCDCAATGEPCDCDPLAPPFTDEQIDAARAAAEVAERAVAKARSVLAGTPPSFDAFEAARAAGSRYCWWPLDQIVDPRVRRYRGEPLTDAQVQDLGPHNLRSSITNGSILEVPEQ